MDCLRWTADHREGDCVIKSPEIKLVRELYEGVSRITEHPADLCCSMDPNFPDDLQLTDNLYGSSLKIISGRLKAFLEKEIAHNRCEYLPLRILDHQGHLAADDYFILHPLDLCDCIDQARSKVKWNRINPNKIARCKGLVLNQEAIPADYQLFRLAHWGEHILLRADLAEAILAQGFSGVVFKPAAGFKGIG